MTKSHNIVISYHLWVYLKPWLHGALFCNCFISRDMITPISMINVQFSTIFRASIGYAYFLVQAKLTVSANNNKKQPPTHDQTISAQFCSIFHGKLVPISKALVFVQFNHAVMRQLDQFMALLGRPFWTGCGTITSKPHSLINCSSQEVVKHWENAGRLYGDHFMG